MTITDPEMALVNDGCCYRQPHSHSEHFKNIPLWGYIEKVCDMTCKVSNLCSSLEILCLEKNIYILSNSKICFHFQDQKSQSTKHLTQKRSPNFALNAPHRVNDGLFFCFFF